MTIERFEAALAAARTELDYLLVTLAPDPKTLDERGRLAVADELLIAIRPMPDRDLRELFLGAIARGLRLRVRALTERLERLERLDERNGTKSAPTTPAGREEGAAEGSTERIGDERRSRIPSNEHHQNMIDALRAFMVTLKITPDAVGGWLKEGTDQAINQNNKRIVLSFLLKYRHYEGVSCTYVVETMEALMEEGRAERRAMLIGRFTGRPASAAGRAALVAWVKAVTGGEDELHVAVMLHWVWQIKRLATGQRTQHDMMVILYGRQGKGKSTATGLLTAPWHELVTDINSENLTDERKFNILSTSIIGRWEEMQGAGKADVAALKHTISTPLVCYRQLSTHIHERELRTMGFIGTSNDPVDQLIADQTGMRRFYEIPAEEINQAAVNAIDYDALWLAVSEADPAPILEHLVAVREKQADLVHRDAVSLWLDAETWERLETIEEGAPFGAGPGGGAPRLIVPAYNPDVGETFDHLSVRFKAWCRRVGQPLSQVTRLAQRLQQQGFVLIRPRVGDPVAGGKAKPGPRRYFRPLPPGPTPEQGLTRGAKLEATPGPTEDRFTDGDQARDAGQGGDDGLPF
jgi:hypothetical protein